MMKAKEKGKAQAKRASALTYPTYPITFTVVEGHGLNPYRIHANGVPLANVWDAPEPAESEAVRLTKAFMQLRPDVAMLRDAGLLK